MEAQRAALGGACTNKKRPRRSTMAQAMLIGDGAAIAFELTIPAGSVGAGRTVMELVARPEFPRSGVFAALYREGGQVEAPRGSTVVDAGSTVLLVSRRDEVHLAITALTAPA